MILSTQDLAISILKSAGNKLPADFSGLGIVIYHHLDSLPYLPLNVLSAGKVMLPVSGIDKIALVLAEISSTRSEWHDGFHFIDMVNQRLTHVAQYLSPPLTNAAEDVISAVGARQMTAILSTRIDGISGAGLLNSTRELSYFENGKQLLRYSTTST